MQSQATRLFSYQPTIKNWRELEVLHNDYSKQLIYLESKALSYHLYQDPIRKCKVQAYRVKVNQKHASEAAQIYQWRRNTQLPVNKIFFVNIVKQTNTDIIFDVFSEFCQVRMGQLYQIPLSQALYLLKQALIGFQRLFNKFGSFEISANLVMINQYKKCKVWVTENIQHNFIKTTTESQNQFLHKILELFSEHVKISTNSKVFFENIMKAKCFIQAILYIVGFAKDKNIKIPNKFILKTNCIIRNSMQTLRVVGIVPTIHQHKYSHSKSFKYDQCPAHFTSRTKINEGTYEKRMKNSSEHQSPSKRQSVKLPSQMFSTMNKSNTATNNEKRKSNISNTTNNIFENEQGNLSAINTSSCLNKFGNLTTSRQFEINVIDVNGIRNSSHHEQQPYKKYVSPLIKIAQSHLQGSIVEHSSQQQSPLRRKTKLLESQDQQQTKQVKKMKQDIFRKNGWKFQDIVGFDENMKTSVQIGKQVNLVNNDHPFLLFSQHNLRVCDSFLPEGQL